MQVIRSVQGLVRIALFAGTGSLFACTAPPSNLPDEVGAAPAPSEQVAAAHPRGPAVSQGTTGADWSHIYFQGEARMGVDESTVGTDERRFVLGCLNALNVYVWWEGNNMRESEIRYYSPDGALFWRDALDLGLAQPYDSGHGIWRTFPIAGTNVTSLGMVGRWKVEMSIEPSRSVSGEFILTAN